MGLGWLLRGDIMPIHRTLTGLLAPSFLLLAGAADFAAPQLIVRLAPGAPDAAQHIPYVDVTLTVQDLHANPGDALFELPLIANTVVTSGKDLQQLSFADRAGLIAITVQDKAEDGSNTTRSWRAGRSINGVVTVRYRVPIDAAAAPLALPQYEIRTENSTFSAAANAFVLQPTDTVPRITHVQ
jgi:hypothetical protein